MILAILNDVSSIVLYVFRFMQNFNRNGHPSLLENLQTHCKYSLIESFLETLTDSTKKVTSRTPLIKLFSEHLTGWVVQILIVPLLLHPSHLQGIFLHKTAKIAQYKQDLSSLFLSSKTTTTKWRDWTFWRRFSPEQRRKMKLLVYEQFLTSRHFTCLWKKLHCH